MFIFYFLYLHLFFPPFAYSSSSMYMQNDATDAYTFELEEMLDNMFEQYKKVKGINDRKKKKVSNIIYLIIHISHSNPQTRAHTQYTHAHTRLTRNY